MQSLRLPHTYHPPLLPHPPACCQGFLWELCCCFTAVSVCHSSAHASSCRDTRVPAGAVRVTCVRAHVSLCQHRQCSRCLVAQAGPARACCIMGSSLCALVTVCQAGGDTLPSLPGALLSHPRGGVAVGPHWMQSRVSSLCSFCPFLTSSIISLTSLLSLLMNGCPSCRLHRGQSPTSLCTHISAPHGSRADTAAVCDGAGRAEQ